MTILVVDAQGGGLGKALVERLKAADLPAQIVAAGANSAATAAMRKGGADAVATGENAILYNAAQADIITGGIGLISANAMLGEISPAIAGAISASPAVKVLVPLNRCNIRVAGCGEKALPQRLEEAVGEIRNIIAKQ